MEKYLQQLVGDLLEAQRPEKDWDESEQSFEEYLEEVKSYQEYEESSSDPTFGQVCGIDKGVFPSSEKLEAHQIDRLIIAIQELMMSWNLRLDLPGFLSPERVYFFHLEMFDIQTQIVNSGIVEISFCEEDFNLCPFNQKYCECQKSWEEHEAKERKYDEQIQIFIEGLDKKLSLSNDKMKVIISNEKGIIIESQSVSTLAEWFDISMADFPKSFQLWEKRANQISEIIMRLLPPKDVMIPILNTLEWESRFNSLKKYLENKVWFDGTNTLYFLPISEEEKSKYKSPLDNLMDLDNRDIDLEDDTELPF